MPAKRSQHHVIIRFENPNQSCSPLHRLMPEARSSAGTRPHDHVFAATKDCVLLVVEVKEIDVIQFVGSATRLADRFPSQKEHIHSALNVGMGTGVVLLAQREGTLPLALVGVVPLRKYDPVRPSQLIKVDVQRVAPTR